MLVENALSVVGRGKLENYTVIKNYGESVSKANMSRFHIEEVLVNIITRHVTS